MSSIQIFVDSGDESGIDSRIIQYAKSILLSSDPGQVDGLIKEKTRAKRSRHVFKLDIEGNSYFFKLYSNHNRLKGFQDLFRGQRAKRALEISSTLGRCGFKTAKPVAALEISDMSCRKRSVFVTESARGIPFHNVFTEENSESYRLEVFQRLGHLYQELIDHGIYHYDLNLTNCWLHENEIMLLDVDDVRQFRRLGLIRLFLNIEKHNLILMRHIKRYPDSWVKDQHRHTLINELSSRYIKPYFLTGFVKQVERRTLQHISNSAEFRNR